MSFDFAAFTRAMTSFGASTEMFAEGMARSPSRRPG